MNKEVSKQKEIPKILKFYSLSGLISIQRISVGLANDNFLVKTKQGEYVLKFINAYRNEIFKNDLAIQRKLKELGIRSPVYIRNLSGDYIYRKGKYRVVVSKKVRGVRPRKVSIKLAYSIGRVLAQFHLGITDLPNSIQGWMNVNSDDSKTAKILRKADLPIGITHGDMHEGNIHVLDKKKDKVYAIFDFEEAGEDLLVVDLARSILAVCVEEQGTKIDERLMESEIKGYQSIRLLEENEKIHFGKAFTHAVDKCIKWFSENDFERYIENHKLRLKSFRSPFE
ncbi:phosphotransferase [Candidatus Dojkabacteria bacterium]|nr:phosphotransferase [Candidatus Dojkabacteria bacterium]